MASRRRKAQYWAMFLAGHEALVAASGLPSDVLHSPTRFRRLLSEGVVSIAGAQIASLGDLDTQQWAEFEGLCRAFFNEFESYAPLEQFLALKHELRRRGSGFVA